MALLFTCTRSFNFFDHGHQNNMLLAVEVIDQVNSPNVKHTFDVYHQKITEYEGFIGLECGYTIETDEAL